MNTNRCLFATAAMIMAVGAIMLGHAAGMSTHLVDKVAYLFGACTGCAVVGVFTLAALRSRSAPSSPVEPVPNRGWCRTDWSELKYDSDKPRYDARSITTEYSEP